MWGEGSLSLRGWRDSAPLCPAGHLPHKGGDWMSPPLSPITNLAEASAAPELLISPQVGEMSGRTEGGVTELGAAPA
ncbi:hypothetical protein DPM33_27440 [Mesorhizobium hawassense]|uniref:Lytic murein transglycosylase n=1 Tax=Mesorhizobium hawassense TaxID=1209954 RepID=A0A330HKH6_9HYPH|nr:hypothetical protein DPM33_27440 [Mesorhizobium hawassense]